MTKVKVAMDWLAACAGCEMSVLDMDERLVQLLEKNRAIIIVPAWWKFYWWINRLSPSLGLFLSQRQFQKVQKAFGIK